MLKAALLVYILLAEWSFNYGEAVGECPHYSPYSKSPELQRLLHKLEDTGKENLMRRNVQGLQQFIAYVVVSESKTDTESEKIKVVVNKDKPEKCESVHGEHKCIRDGDFTQEIKNFRKHTNEIPILVIYSYYIPCYNIPKIKYSCSEDLASLAFVLQGKDVVMIVAYSHVFPKTDKGMSLRLMAADGIVVLEKNGKDFVDACIVNRITPPSRDNNNIFQTLFHICLQSSDGSFKACTQCLGKQQEKLTIYFVNYVTYLCTRGRRNSAKLTKHTKMQLETCIIDYVDNEMPDSECKTCRNNMPEYKLHISACGIYATDMADFVGYLENSHNSYSNHWVIKPMFWENAYLENFEISDRAMPAVYCALPALDSKTFCMKMKKSDKLSSRAKLATSKLINKWKNIKSPK